MKVVTLCLIFVLKIFSVKLDDDKGPVGPVTIHEISECDPDVNFIKFKADLIEEDDGSKSISVFANLPYDIDQDVTVAVHTKRYDNESKEWVDDGYNFEDKKMLKFIESVIPKIWESFRQQTDPKIEDSTLVVEEEYKIEHFSASYRDINLNSIAYGLFDAQIVATQEDEDILCLKVLIEFFPPENK